MKGHIKQRSKGSWSIVIDVGRDPETGRRRQQWHTVRGTKRDAEQELTRLLHSLETGGYVKPNRVTLGEWLDDWLGGYVEANCSPRTKTSYEMIIRRHVIPELGMIALNQLTPHHLQTFYNRQKRQGRLDGKGQLSSRTVRYCHSLLAEALGHAVKMGLIARNVAEATDPPRLERKARPTLAPENVFTFLETAAKTPYHTFFSTLLYTGMRRGEALALRWKNVDLDLALLSVVETAYRQAGEYVIKEPKTPYSRRQIALSPSLAALLREHRAEQAAQRLLQGKPLADDDFVFAHPDGRPFDPSTVTHAFRKTMRKAGLPHIRLHDLRHTHATLLLSAGVHPKIVSERLGHSSIKITLDTYSHVLPGLQEAAAQRFDDFLVAKGQKGNVSKMLAKTTEPRVGVAGFEPATT